jgi:transposase-like protein
VGLSPVLSSVNLTFHCPHCGHALVRPGKWFKSATRFKCDACKADVRLTYSRKLALFERHLEGVEKPAGETERKKPSKEARAPK